MIFVFVFIIIIVIAICMYYAGMIFEPLNYILKKDPSPRNIYYNKKDKDAVFPIGITLEKEWKSILSEGQFLYNNLENKSNNYLNNYRLNIDSNIVKNWTTISLRVFGRDNLENIKLCPTLGNILSSHPEIKTCLFSIMESGKVITPHRGPYDGLLRYQLALDIPNDGECYLHVENIKYYWKEGESVLFDETYIHGAVNNTSKSRMVLLIDIERPYHYTISKILNNIVIWFMGMVS